MMTQKYSGRATSIPMGLAAGAGVSLVVTAVGAAIVAWMTLRGTIRVDWTGYCAMIILMMSAACGAMTAIRLTRRLRAQMGMACAGIYYLCLGMINALFWGGQLRGMGVTAAVIACGAMLVILLVPGGENRAGCRRRKKHLR